jgi:hypothetical protein
MERLEGVRRKLDRAKEMIEEIYDAVVGYIAEEPYEVVGEFNPETSEYVIRGKVTKPTRKIGIIAGDAAHNLRSALDHLAWQLALLNTATPYRLTQFPIARSKREFRKDRSQT